MKLLPQRRWQRWLILLGLLSTTGAFIMIPACASVGALPKGDALKKIQASPNYGEDRFVNTLPLEQPPFGRTLKEWVVGADHTTPDNPIEVAGNTGEVLNSEPGVAPRITWLGHSTTLVEIEGHRLLLDPVWSDRTSPFSWAGPKRFFAPPLPLEELPEIDAVLISHDHYDHLDKATVVALAAKGYRFIVPLGVGSRMQSWDIDADQIRELDWWDEASVGDLRIVATPARHFSGRSMVMADRDETLWAGFAMIGEQHRIYYTGDTGMFPGFKEIGERLGPFDATLIEIGAYNKNWADFHIGPEQAVQAVEMARGGLLIPVHWATFDLALHSWVEPGERLLVAARAADYPVALPRPGGSVNVDSPPTLARWWPEVDWQSAEEHPIVSSGLAAR